MSCPIIISGCPPLPHLAFLRARNRGGLTPRCPEDCSYTDLMLNPAKPTNLVLNLVVFALIMYIC